MLPAPDNRTLAAYLLSVAESIHEQLNRGLGGDAPARLAECATIAARVAQQLDDAAAPAAEFRAECAALAEAEREFEDAERRRAASGTAPPTGVQRSIDARAVEAYLRAQPLGGPEVEVTEARLLSGGRQKSTALVLLRGSKGLPPECILRQDWQGGTVGKTVVDEFALLERISRADIRAPRPLLLEPGHSGVGEPFILLERLQGRLSGSLFTPPRSAALARELAVQMGRLHALAAAEFRGLVPDGTRTSAQRRELLAGFRRMHGSIGLRSRIVEAAIDWLDAHLEDAGSALCLTHNDIGFHNILVDGERLTALLDWELAELGHPAADLGYVKPFVQLMLPWSRFLEEYQDAGGWRVEPRELRFHTIWNAVRLYELVMQARAALASGRLSDIEISFACADATMRLLHALGNELQD